MKWTPIVERYLAEGIVEIDPYDKGSVLSVRITEDTGDSHIISDNAMGLKLIHYIGSRIQAVGKLIRDPDMSIIEISDFNLKHGKPEHRVPKILIQN